MDINNYFSDCSEVMTALNTQGAFLTVKDRSNRANVMTIGWGLVGIVWRDPIFMVAVRSNRYTFNLLENADDFAVIVPFSDMSKQLIFCGTKSGANMDKFVECELRTIPAKSISSPIIEIECGRCYECKIVQMSAMDKNRLHNKYSEMFYQDKSYHTYYFGKIVECYEV